VSFDQCLQWFYRCLSNHKNAPEIAESENLNLARLPIPPRGRTQSSRPGWRQAIAAGGTNWRNINKPPARRKRQPALNHKINAGVAGNPLQVSFRAGATQ
jgi:hypothetical protein